MKRTPCSRILTRIALGALLAMTIMTSAQLAPNTAQAAQATLTWSTPTTYTDGSSLTSLGGYTVHAGIAPGSYSQHFNVGNLTSYTVSELSDATKYYFSVSAQDAAGNASAPSNEVAFTTPAPPPPAALYTLTSSAGTGGTISPAGSIVVSQGTSQTFKIAPATGYQIQAVTVDGVSVGAVASYTFSNVVANHKIAASFAAATPTPDTTTATWQNQSIAPQTGSFSAVFDVTPSVVNINAIAGFSAAAAADYTGVAALVRFNPTGTIDARNGSTYAAKVALPYSAGKSYRIRMQVDVKNHRYDAYVTSAGGTETQIAAAYAFRTEQATVTTLNTLSRYAKAGTLQLQNLSVTSASAPLTSSALWKNSAIASKTGTFTATFDTIPNAAKINAVTGFSALAASRYEDVAALVRFNPTGTIDVRNGSTYSAKVALPYAAGKSYRVRMVINVPNHRYDVYVTPAGGTETQIAAAYAFRTEQAAATVLNNISLFAGTGSHQVLNLSLQ
ncbi:fibronectin type III domain-containing protein [Citrifermentans pelophilum]|uniref:fibronectin type III domain-containing protein n=1 Tax=Geoanaerobacter pelophilus TaxID=60036 RepID=UPI001F23A829|nr:fibronectin type III domain-containing protein [Geoanaerobacter pelophilus]